MQQLRRAGELRLVREKDEKDTRGDAKLAEDEQRTERSPARRPGGDSER